ncbi:unnamed protein product [Urochloa humidicola]
MANNGPDPMIIDVSSDDEDDNNQPEDVVIIDVSSDEEDDGDQQEDEVIIDVSSDEEEDGQQDEEVEEVDNDDQRGEEVDIDNDNQQQGEEVEEVDNDQRRGEEVDVDNNQNQQQVDNQQGVDNNQNQQGERIYIHWPFSDELLILNTLAAYRRKSSGDKEMANRDLYDAINGHLQRDQPTFPDLSKKVSALNSKFKKAVSDHGPGHRARDQRLYELSKLVWPEELNK